ncbi:MAG: sulfatase-like hydrolase/transferase [Caldilineaceae bacterium]
MATQPNILFLITDQQRVDTLGCYGNPICRTPNVDGLAARGVRFDQAYTPTAICTPARASLITGVLPFEHKLLANFERNVGYITELPADTDSFAYHLRDAGYNVGTVGKWHIGAARGPDAFGFDGLHYPGWGQPVQHPDYLRYLDEHGYPHFAVRDEIRGVFPNGQPGNVIAGIYTGPVEASFPYFLAERYHPGAERYAAQDAPLSWRASGSAWHLPYYIPSVCGHVRPGHHPTAAAMAETFAGKPTVQRQYAAHWTFDSFTPDQWRKLIAMYCGFLSRSSTTGGAHLDADARAGRRDQILSPASDHGAFVGSHKMQDKGPPCTTTSTGCRWWRICPAVVATRGAVEERFVSLMDLPATFLDLVGGRPTRTRAAAWLRSCVGDAADDRRNHILAEFHGHHFPLSPAHDPHPQPQAGHQPAGRHQLLRSGQRSARVDQPD